MRVRIQTVGSGYQRSNMRPRLDITPERTVLELPLFGFVSFNSGRVKNAVGGECELWGAFHAWLALPRRRSLLLNLGLSHGGPPLLLIDNDPDSQ